VDHNNIIASTRELRNSRSERQSRRSTETNPYRRGNRNTDHLVSSINRSAYYRSLGLSRAHVERHGLVSLINIYFLRLLNLK